MDTFKQDLALVWQRSKALLLLMLVIILFVGYFVSRYKIAVNGAKSDCLNVSVFLVDTWDKSVHPGDIVMFRMQVNNGIHPVGSVWAKKVAAIGGQTVHVDHYSVRVDSRNYPLSSDFVLSKLKIDPSSLKSTWNLAQDQLFMIGETYTSYDSRFWGPIQKKDVMGKAYAIF